MNLVRVDVGKIYPYGVPGEGPVAQLSGGSFNVVIFESNLTARSVNLFKNRPLRTGLFLYESGGVPVPFFVVKLLGTGWEFDVSLSLPAEPPEQASKFLDDAGNVVALILCDYPSGRVRAIRAISIKLETMERIKAECRSQPSRAAVDNVIDECYASFSLDDMIELVQWEQK